MARMAFYPAPGVDVSDADAAVGEVKSPKTFYSVAAPRKTGTLPTKAIVAGAETYEEGYHAGNPGGLSAIDTDLAVENIKKDVVIFGKVGTFESTLTVTEEWAAADADTYTNAQVWTTLREITIDAAKKIIVWLQIWSEYITTGTGIIEGQILVDDVQKAYVSHTLVDGYEGRVDSWGAAVHYYGNGGVVKAQCKTEKTAARTRPRTGMYSISI